MRAISREINAPVGSVHRLLHDLSQESVVQRNDQANWELSFRLMQIIGTHWEGLSLPALARPKLEQLAADTKETAFLAVPNGNEIVYLDKVQTDMYLQLNVELGTRRPLHCTALGKAILAYLPFHRQEEIMTSGELLRFTPNTITDPNRLIIELDRVKSSGYATDSEEIILGVHCIATPILNYAGRAVGAISVAGTEPRVGGDRFDLLRLQVIDAGKDISRRLGNVLDRGSFSEVLNPLVRMHQDTFTNFDTRS